MVGFEASANRESRRQTKKVSVKPEKATRNQHENIKQLQGKVAAELKKVGTKPVKVADTTAKVGAEQEKVSDEIGKPLLSPGEPPSTQEKVAAEKGRVGFE